MPTLRQSWIDAFRERQSPLDGLRTISSGYVDRLRAGAFVPIVDASLTYDRILAAGAQSLAGTWAKTLDLPYDEGDPVGRVARFQVYRSGNDLRVKEDYLRFLMETLQNQANASGMGDIVDEFRSDMRERTFTELARVLGYPNAQERLQDPLLLLAVLPVPFYVTTSYHDYLEWALRIAGKEPRTAVCRWNDAAANLVRPEHLAGPYHDLSYLAPMVFHVFGHEKYPETLVLSEDDHLAFLERIAEDSWRDPEDWAIPEMARARLAESPLLCLGFHPESLEFKALCRGALSLGTGRYDRVFQYVDGPDQQTMRQYIERYLKDRGFDVFWGTPADLLDQLKE